MATPSRAFFFFLPFSFSLPYGLIPSCFFTFLNQKGVFSQRVGVFNAPSLPPLLIGKIPEIVVHQKEENDLRTKRKKGQVISPPSNFSFYIYTSILQLLTTTTTLYGCLHRPTHTILFLFLPTLLPFFFFVFKSAIH